MIFKSVGNKTQQGDSPAALKWGADHGAVISQNSWGYVVDTDNDGIISAEKREIAKKLTISATEKAAVDYFIKYAGCDNNLNQLPSYASIGIGGKFFGIHLDVSYLTASAALANTLTIGLGCFF